MSIFIIYFSTVFFSILSTTFLYIFKINSPAVYRHSSGINLNQSAVMEDRDPTLSSGQCPVKLKCLREKFNDIVA
jgi:hypothetical protein